MTDVRSMRLNYYKPADTNFHKVWTSPGGMVTLLKWVTIVNAGAAAATATVIMATAAGNQQIYGKSMAVGEVAQLSVWMAMNPTDWITVASNPVGVSFWFSGSVLLGDPPVPPPTPTMDVSFDQAQQLPGPDAP